MGIGKYGHPKYYAKRAVNWERHEREAESAAIGCLAWLLVVGMVVAAILLALSVPGHLLGLTPTFGQVVNKDGAWLDRHYQHWVWGYVITVLVLLTVVAFVTIAVRAHA
jgi:hypothetical protein